ncbi:glucosamine-6-phosphate deaminase [Negadavirga shengliensis]|uniref:Glucosamine-6-phosphate deaminase n=1 Tax=Negadavirga shengliensis TaxID=1389218 RepID=A0ABV9SZA1_9BACT
MKIFKSKDPIELGKAAGETAASLIKKAIDENGSAHIILATGTSQFETISRLLLDRDIDWVKVTMFHLDEYIGISDTHPASFRKYLKERFLDKVSGLKGYYLIDGEAEPEREAEKLGELISRQPVDVALAGIGENGHLAFNDPPADFETDRPYLVVELDEACRRQQMNEGWFSSLESVPKKAISMSIKQIMKSKNIICSVPDKRKAQAVKDCVEKPVSHMHPASILQRHPSCYLYLDEASASLLEHAEKIAVK